MVYKSQQALKACPVCYTGLNLFRRKSLVFNKELIRCGNPAILSENINNTSEFYSVNITPTFSPTAMPKFDEALPLRTKSSRYPKLFINE